MPGISTRPRAATVAGPEPEMAAKKHATTTQTMARPPLTCPTQVSARWIRRSEMPAFSMMLPARMKNGMASRTNLLVDAEKIRGRLLIMVDTGCPAPCTSIARILEEPRHTAMGAPRNSRMAKEINRILAIISFPPLSHVRPRRPLRSVLPLPSGPDRRECGSLSG